MESALQLFGYLILTFLVIMGTFLAILLSIYQEGVSKLITQYEMEKSNSEQNLIEQVEKQKKAESLNLPEIERSVKKLKIDKKKAKTKLSYLNPKKQTLRLFIVFLISFLGVILAIAKKTSIYLPVFIVISSVFFVIGLFISWKLLCILIEAKEIIDRDNNETQTKTLELLSSIAKKGENYFLQDVYIVIESVVIDNNEREFTWEPDIKKSIDIDIRNLENRMAKDIEIGLIFPRDFIIEETDNYSFFTDKNGEQIIRYRQSSIHGSTTQILTSLILTPIKKGEYIIKTFVKAENIEATYRNFNLKIES